MAHPTPEKPLPEPPRTYGARLHARITNLFSRFTKAKTPSKPQVPPKSQTDAPSHPLQTTLYPPIPKTSGKKLARTDAARRTSTFNTAMASLRRRSRKVSDVRPGYFDSGERRDASAESADGLEMNIAGSAIPSILEELEPESGQDVLKPEEGIRKETQGHQDVREAIPGKKCKGESIEG
ncbi:hypothetical protein ACHAQH_009235 [Verticillium albo-atrum]